MAIRSALVLLLPIMACAGGCRAEPASPTAAEAADLKHQPIHLEQTLGNDLTIVAMSIAPRRANAWEVTLSSRVRSRPSDAGTIWVHAYATGAAEYRDLASTNGNDDPMLGGGVFPPNQPGHLIKHGFLLAGAGVFN